MAEVKKTKATPADKPAQAPMLPGYFTVVLPDKQEILENEHQYYYPPGY